MKSTTSKIIQSGSSPISHPKYKTKSLVNSTSQKVQNFESAPILAHFSKVQSPGRDTTEQQMNEQIKLHSSGNRWYVSYYLNQNNKQVRKRIYGRINAEKDLHLRMKLLLKLQAEVYLSLQNKRDYLKPKLTGQMTIYQAIEEMVSQKKGYLKHASFKTITHHTEAFKEWLIKSNNQGKYPNEIKKDDIKEYRNYLLEKGLSNRTVNNSFKEIRTIFYFLMEKDDTMIYRNPCSGIKLLPSWSESHVAFSDAEVEMVAKHLQEHDNNLLFYIKFVAYAFLRTEEIKSLQIRDIDMRNWIITLSAKDAKTNVRMYKIIPEIFRKDFIERKINEFPPEYYVFSKGAVPGPTRVGVTFFSRRFIKTKKKFNFSKHYTIYGFRHTFISQLLRSGKPSVEVMKLTGHRTLAAFEIYARSLSQLPPKDLSDGFTGIL